MPERTKTDHCGPRRVTLTLCYLICLFVLTFYVSTNLISAGEPGEGSDDESTGDSANVVADLAVDNSDAMLAGQVELSDDVAPNDPSENAGSGGTVCGVVTFARTCRRRSNL